MSRNFLITETLSSTMITWFILKRLVLPYSEWDAFKVGIIDKDGKKLKQPVTSAELAAWTSFDRFMYNLRQVLEKFVGKSSLAHYLSAMYLLRDDIALHGKYSNILNELENFNDFTLEKQKKIYYLFQELDNRKVNLTATGDLELDIYKIKPVVEEIISKQVIDESII